jgi:hypothetical protein
MENRGVRFEKRTTGSEQNLEFWINLETDRITDTLVQYHASKLGVDSIEITADQRRELRKRITPTTQELTNPYNTAVTSADRLLTLLWIDFDYPAAAIFETRDEANMVETRIIRLPTPFEPPGNEA